MGSGVTVGVGKGPLEGNDGSVGMSVMVGRDSGGNSTTTSGSGTGGSVSSPLPSKFVGNWQDKIAKITAP